MGIEHEKCIIPDGIYNPLIHKAENAYCLWLRERGYAYNRSRKKFHYPYSDICL